MLVKEEKFHRIESQEEMDILEGLPYRSDTPVENAYEEPVPYIVASQLKFGTRAYLMTTGAESGYYVTPCVITEIISVTPADGKNDTKLKNKHNFTSSFLIENTRYHVGIDETTD